MTTATYAVLRSNCLFSDVSTRAVTQSLVFSSTVVLSKPSQNCIGVQVSDHNFFCGW